jgi:hypothetical protein
MNSARRRRASAAARAIETEHEQGERRNGERAADDSN